MKLTNSLILFTMVNAQQNATSDDTSIGRMGGGVTGGMGIRRYSDLLKLVKVFTPEFDERKYWAYGCNCLILGDRPMSDPGFGRPVDPLDQICKQYKVIFRFVCLSAKTLKLLKDCQKCVKREFGDECIGEFVKYDWRMRRGQPQCINAPGMNLLKLTFH